MKKRIAAALKYDAEVPKVVASGSGYLAERIIARASESRVPLHEDEELAQALNTIAIGEEIPVELYVAVAKVLAWVYMVDRNYE